MATNPIQAALDTAGTVQGAHRALEHHSSPQVRVLDRAQLGQDALANYGAQEGQLEYGEAVLALFDRAAKRGDGVAVYENHDLGHPEVGERQYVTYGSTAAQLETRRGTYPSSQSHQYGDDIIPLQLPDIGGRINWRYRLVAVAGTRYVETPGVAEYSQQDTVTGRSSSSHG